MEVTPSEMETEVREEQPRKAKSLMEATLDGMETEAREAQLKKA